ncbi:sulfite exporter TauE/SafE family protein [Thiolapillus sp.]|uniref:HoxN/HupN/NixA family nickel/cobalt transporter n=1 Tax=Thiolapillus sp. TaxID=2017437 RepID=UPI0025E4200F|nr:sulfite exporter TauE/SafE family protein [Thiolapillus sp.]
MLFSLLIIGFLLGMRHALEADHVAAVASLATRSSSIRQTAMHGAFWGIGHTLTLFIFGSVVLLMDTMISEQLAGFLEFTVGIMLIVLGCDVLWRLYRERIHFHVHSHNNIRHFHAHSHAGEGSHRESRHQHKHHQYGRALFVGLMHGMAGSAALIVLTLQTVQSTATGLLYILLFGIGSIAGMALLSTIIAIPMRYSSQRLTWIYNSLHSLVGVITISIGSLTVINYLDTI